MIILEIQFVSVSSTKVKETICAGIKGHANGWPSYSNCIFFTSHTLKIKLIQLECGVISIRKYLKFTVGVKYNHL